MFLPRPTNGVSQKRPYRFLGPDLSNRFSKAAGQPVMETSVFPEEPSSSKKKRAASHETGSDTLQPTRWTQLPERPWEKWAESLGSKVLWIFWQQGMQALFLSSSWTPWLSEIIKACANMWFERPSSLKILEAYLIQGSENVPMKPTGTRRCYIKHGIQIKKKKRYHLPLTTIHALNLREKNKTSDVKSYHAIISWLI